MTPKQLRIIKALRFKTVANGCTVGEAAAAKAKADELEAKYGKAPDNSSIFHPVRYPFRFGTKRRACFDLLNRMQGATVLEGIWVTNWNRNVVLSEYYEIAKACGSKISRKGDTYHLTGGKR